MTNPLVYLVEVTKKCCPCSIRIICAESYEIKAFRFGKEGLDALEQQPPQVLLLDLELPDMDGMELLRYVCEQGLAYQCRG